MMIRFYFTNKLSKLSAAIPETSFHKEKLINTANFVKYIKLSNNNVFSVERYLLIPGDKFGAVLAKIITVFNMCKIMSKFQL